MLLLLQMFKPNQLNFFCGIVVFLFYAEICFAQKVTIVTKSPLTQIILPQNSKLDKRGLMVGAAKMLLADEAKKNNVSLTNIEVLSLPPLNSKGYSEDSLIAQAENAGWKISGASEESKYFWLDQNDKHILGYVSTTKKETSLIFAESNQFPQINTITESPQTTSTTNTTQVQNNVSTQVEEHANVSTAQVIEQPVIETSSSSTTSSGFRYSTTNFDDGWTATEKDDWVEVKKDNIKVLLHYPKEGTVFPADPAVLISGAWNILVAPRYSNLQNFKTTYINDYNKPYLGMGSVTENETGTEVFVVLFRQGGEWIEVVSPDKNTFIQQFKFDLEAIQYDSDTKLLLALSGMSGYNKFAIDVADFKGKWTNDFSGIQQLYNVYSGNYAGMHMNSANEEFSFGDNNTYNWKLLVVNSFGGVANANKVKSSGVFKILNNWQIFFPKIESESKTYNAFWSCIKGARFLNLLNAVNPGSGVYQQYGLSK